MLPNNICKDVTQTSVTNMLQQQHVPVAPATTTLLHHPVTCTLSIHRVVQNGSLAMPAWYKDACWLRGELATEARSMQPPSPSSTALGATTGPEASCLALPHVRSPTLPAALSSVRTPTTTAARQASSPCLVRFEWSSSWSTSPAACGLRCSTSGALEITTCSLMHTTSSLTTSAAASERSPSALFSATLLALALCYASCSRCTACSTVALTPPSLSLRCAHCAHPRAHLARLPGSLSTTCWP